MAIFAVATVSTRPESRARPRAVAQWLLAVAGLVFLMVVVGGITRLTESGLSITRWEPVSGILPPLSRADWLIEFERYRATSQYQLANRGMNLSQFQAIYFWEYVHRLLGRVIGLTFALPLVWFWARRAIPAGYGWRLVGLLVLGGFQGAIGWWMVASGLVDRVDVAPERLMVHLMTALLILAALVWTALDLLAPAPAPARRPRAWVAPMAGLLTLQIAVGALVAGLEAGYAFNTWPLMGATLAPPGLFVGPLVDDALTTQFVHRTLAYAVAAVALWAAWRLRSAGAGWRAHALAGVVALQFALGVATIVLGVPLVLGVAHQAGAALLVAVTAAAAHWATRPVAGRVRAA